MRLANNLPAWLLRPDGPGHRLTHDGQWTLCGQSAVHAVKTNVIGIHVYVNHSFCMDCFGIKGVQWP